VRHLLDRLRKLPLKDRASVPGLSSDRADIIVAGMAIIDRIMERFEVNVVQVHNRGVRDGLLLAMIDEQQLPSDTQKGDREAAIDRLALTCGGDVPHGRHTARIAAKIFSQLMEPLELSEEDLPLLEAAARLQDVGYLINYDQHHKHSYHLIMNSRLPGFSPRELAIIANVARYHRGANPKRKHENFRQLGEREQLRVRQLAAIVRVAGGTDRTNTQQVSDVKLDLHDDTIKLQLVADVCPEVDLWATERRAELFEKVFDKKLEVGWADPAQRNGQPKTKSRKKPV
jgi:exopolyphosphatase/guanosine-5'-triphosphate,3'-diphosphate pyrophosphatase